MGPRILANFGMNTATRPTTKAVIPAMTKVVVVPLVMTPAEDESSDENFHHPAVAPAKRKTNSTPVADNTPALVIVTTPVAVVCEKELSSKRRSDKTGFAMMAPFQKLT
jgi:hypothetical protein